MTDLSKTEKNIMDRVKAGRVYVDYTKQGAQIRTGKREYNAMCKLIDKGLLKIVKQNRSVSYYTNDLHIRCHLILQ